MEIHEVLTRGVEQVLPLKKGLAKLMGKKKITLYQGFDPTAKSLHIGHLIGIRKLAQFQKLGHKVIFLIGDGTGQAGDPSGKLKTREKFYTNKELKKNAEGYKKQVGKIIKFDGTNSVQILYNSSWLNKLKLVELLEIAEHFTVQQLTERDMFRKRIKEGLPINLREFLYPLLQGYDSVDMNVDLEIGGNDQLFNMMAGRHLMKAYRDKEKFVLTMKLLTDPTGKKMGKSEGNAINLTDKSEVIFGKVMSMPDTMNRLGIELLTDLDFQLDKNPMDVKKKIAFELVKQIHGEDEAVMAQSHFERTFQKRSFPQKTKTVIITTDTNIKDVVAKEVGSNSKAKRLLREGAVKQNGKTVTNFAQKVRSGDQIKIGKKIFLKIRNRQK